MSEKVLGLTTITLTRVPYAELGIDYGADETEQENYREDREYAGQPMTATKLEVKDWDGETRIMYRITPEELHDAAGLNFGEPTYQYGWTFNAEDVKETV
ncbi:hypothetical protein [Vibrio phage VCPH]|nr:hypothetical protein [Vibrio phage VCPH]